MALSFWQKKWEATKSVGKIALAGAGMVVAAGVGTLLTGLGYMVDLGAPVIALGLVVAAGVSGLAGLVAALLGEGELAEGAFKIASGILKFAGELAIINTVFGVNDTKSAEFGSSAWKGTKDAIKDMDKIISTEVDKLRMGPTTAVSSERDYLSASRHASNPRGWQPL